MLFSCGSKGRIFHEAFEFIKTFAIILATLSPLTKFINHSYILDYVKVYSRMLHVHDLRRMPNERSEDFQRNKMRVINLICANINTHANASRVFSHGNRI